MKINTLELKAFGPFTDKTLDFRSPDQGLHIIFGPNEAGKSSSLRGLKALLYGFPERTTDNFLHPNDQLMVGGTLRGNDDLELSFLRRKKRKADILDSRGNPLEPSILLPFLHGIDAAVFDSLYGIDHSILVQGGEDILAQKGEVGQALFAAGAGLSSLRKILLSLDAESDDLFKARGSKQQINLALNEYKHLQKQIRETTLSGRQWQEHYNALQRAKEELTGVENIRREKEILILHLKRRQQTLPLLALRKKYRAHLAEIGNTPVLPSDFSSRRRDIEKTQHSALQQHAEAASRLSLLKEKQQTISLNHPLLDQAESIEELYQRLGSYRKAMDDRPRLEGMRIACRTEAADLLHQIRPDLSLDRVESMRPAAGKKSLIQTLSRRHESLVQRRRQTEKQFLETSNELQAINSLLDNTPRPADNSSLLQALKLARKAGDIDESLASMKSHLEETHQRFSADIQRLGLWKGTIGELTSLQVPLAETISRFSSLFRDLDEQKRDLSREKTLAQEKLKQVQQHIQDFQYDHEVPTEAELNQMREKRDRGWSLIRRNWLDGEDIFAESSAFSATLPLPDAYEKKVHEADNTADRLRREADRVHTFAALKSEEQTLLALLNDFNDKESLLQKTAGTLMQEWHETWSPSGIEPLSPPEMLAWLGNFDTLRFHAGEIKKIQRDLTAKEKQRQILCHSLVTKLQAMGDVIQSSNEDLAPLLIQAEAVIDLTTRQHDQQQKLEEKKTSLEKEAKRVQADRKDAEQELLQWQKQWQDAIQSLGLESPISPDEASDILETLQHCFDKVKEADVLHKRIEGIDKDASGFSREVDALIPLIAPDLKTQPPAQAVIQLQSMLTQNREEKVLHTRHLEEIATTEEELRNTALRLKEFNQQIAHLLSAAGCTTIDELDGAERKSKEWLEVSGKLNDAEENLSLLAEGLPMEELEAQAAGANPDTLPGEIDTLSREIEHSLNPDIKRLSQIIGEENKELERMDGSAMAAEAAERAQSTLAKIRRLADRYVRVRLAATILHQEIERFRAENQDPIVAIASRLFAQLTLGSFAGLRTDVDNLGTPILMGERIGSNRVSVEKMSSGTRDQLYLALRLAALEWRIHSSEPMPFIIDDILINFDDNRTRVTLKILADLAEKTQVILFTHHRQVVDAASKITGKGSVHIHEL